MKEKVWSKMTWLNIVLLSLGLIFILFAALTEVYSFSSVLKTVCYSLGCSLISTSIINYFRSKAEDVKLEDIEKKVVEMQKYYKHYIPNNRIVIGTHLNREFPRMINNSNSDEVLYIDVLGIELNNFWNDQNLLLLGRKNIKLRMIVQDPDSIYFSDIIKNEEFNEKIIRNNIYNLTKRIYSLSLNPKNNQKIDIKWISFPASVTITRVNEQLYVRSRIINSSHNDEYHFFEIYQKGDKPYDTFMKYFNDLWNKEDTDCEIHQKKCINN